MLQDEASDGTPRKWFMSAVMTHVVLPVVLLIAGAAMCFVAREILLKAERSAVRTAVTMRDAALSLVEVQSDVIDRSNDGKFVLVRGMAAVGDALVDEEFGVSVKAARLERQVEMLQWEARFGVFGLEVLPKVFSLWDGEPPEDWLFRKVWSSVPIDSSDFNNWADKRNPETKAHRAAEWTAQDLRVGAFQVGRVLASRVGELEQLELSPSEQYRSPGNGSPPVVDGRLFLGRDPAGPQIGELRVTYRAQRPGLVTVVGEQRGDGVLPYEGSGRSGFGVADLRNGSWAPWRMLFAIEFGMALDAWKQRALGTLIAVIGGGLLIGSPLLFVAWLPARGRWHPGDFLIRAFIIGAVLGAAGAVGTMVWTWVSLRLDRGLPWTPIIGAVLLAWLVWKTARIARAHRRGSVARLGTIWPQTQPNGVGPQGSADS